MKPNGKHQNFAKPVSVYQMLPPEQQPTKNKTRQVRGIAQVDGRTRLGKVAKKFRADLIAHCGGPEQINVVQRELVERCVFLQIKASLLDKKIVDGLFTDYDSKVYCSIVANLSRALLRLGYKESVEIMRMRTERQLMQALTHDRV
jgi:hypothetical protein